MSDEKPDIKKLLPIQAYAAQNKGNYKNADLWGFTVIPKDTILVQLDYEPDRLDKTQTAGQYFTTIDELKKHRDPHNGLVDTVAMSERVQVMAHKDFETKAYSHYPNVTVYQVTKDLPVSYAHADNNRAFGKGGAEQYFVGLDQRDIIQQERVTKSGEKWSLGYLKPIEVLEAKSVVPRRDIYNAFKDAEKNGVKNPEDAVITDINTKFKKDLLNSGDPNAIETVRGIDERNKFSVESREIIETEDWKRLNEVTLPKPRTPEEKLKFAIGGVQHPVRKAELNKILEQTSRSKVPQNLQPYRPTQANKTQIAAKPAIDKDFGIE